MPDDPQKQVQEKSAKNLGKEKKANKEHLFTSTLLFKSDMLSLLCSYNNITYL